MTTTTTTDRATALPQELPALTTTDRIALAIGTRLILRAEQHRTDRAARDHRTEQARAAQAETRAERDAATTFDNRTYAGPTW